MAAGSAGAQGPHPLKGRHGLVPLSAGEIELYARRDEAARRRRRLLDVRDRERRIAQQVTRRYRENIDRLRGRKARSAQLELALQHEVLLSELHQRYQLSLQSMGTAHRNAREKLLELLEQANDEALKWQFNELVVAKHRSGEAIRSHDEEERGRLARRWEVEQNLMRLRDLATKQRLEASEHAKKEREMQAQRAMEAEEAERIRRESLAEEVVTMPRPHANDVVSYHFTRLHCLSTDPATTAPIRGSVKVVRHNTRHPSAKSGVEEAVKYREEVDKRLEQRRRENEENKETANTRGADAMDVIASRKGGEKAMEWLASIDKMERKVLSPESTTTDGDADPVSRLGHTPESVREKGFARMFQISEEDSGELSVFSAGSEHELDDDDMTSLSSTGEETEWVKLKARALFPFDRPRDDGIDATNATNVKPATGVIADSPLEHQHPSGQIAKATDAQMKTGVQPPAPPLGQREERLSDSDGGYTEQDSIELLEDRLQEVLNLRLRRTSPATPQDEEQSQPRLRGPLPSPQRTPGSSGVKVDSQIDSEHYGGSQDTPELISKGDTRQQPREAWSMAERASSVTSADADISSGGTDGEDEKWGIEGNNHSLASLHPDGGAESTQLRLGDGEAGISTQQQVPEFDADGPPNRSLASTPANASLSKSVLSDDPVNAYTDRVRRARRSSTGSSIAQYSLPPSDLHSFFDDRIDSSRMDSDDSFVNELVPMFPNPGSQRQGHAVHSSEGGAVDQYDLPPDEPALKRMSIDSNASSDLGTQSRPSLRVQGSLSSRDGAGRLSRRSSGRFELGKTTQDRPGTDASQSGNELHISTADDDKLVERRDGRATGEILADPMSVFTQYDLPDESDRSSVDGGSLASSRVGVRAFRPSDSGSSHSSIGFAVQLALASGTRRRQKGDDPNGVRQWSHSRIAPMHAVSAADFKRGVLSRRLKNVDDGGINDSAEFYSRRYSSDSSVSVEDHLRYVVSMTATTGDSLPLPLYLPPKVFGEVDMSKPPAPMQLMGSPALSSSTTPSEPADRGSQQAVNSRSHRLNDDKPQSERSNESDGNWSDSMEDERPHAHSSRSSSSRSIWSGSESTDEVYARLQAMKLHALPAARFREFDMRQPPAPAEGLFGQSSSSIDEKGEAIEERSDAEASHTGSVRRRPREKAGSQQSHRSSWSGSEKSDDVLEKFEAMKRGLPAPPSAKGFDMNQPPAPMHDAFEKHSRSSVSSEASSLPGRDKGDDHEPDPRLSPRSSESSDGVYSKLEVIKLHALPAPPPQGLDMSKPPAPMDGLFKQYSLGSSCSDASGFSRREGDAGDGVGASSRGRRPPRDFEEDEEKNPDGDFDSNSDRSFASESPNSETRASKTAASLYVPLEESDDSGDGVSLAEAFQKRHPRFHLRAEQHQQELERRRQQQLARQKQRQQAQQTQTQAQEGGSKRATRPSSAAPSSASVDGEAPLSEEKQQLLDRLAAGARAKVSDKEMKERSRRLYQQLPEVVERRRQEEVLRRRRERLNELREQEKARRLAQRERRQQQRPNA